MHEYTVIEYRDGLALCWHELHILEEKFKVVGLEAVKEKLVAEGCEIISVRTHEGE